MGKKELTSSEDTQLEKSDSLGSLEEDKHAKKQFLLRLSDSLWKELSAWAQDDFRSINGQIEFLLSECVRKKKKGKR